MRRYSNEIFQQLVVAWKFWIPVDIIVFVLISDNWRVPFISATALCWVGILSVVTSKFDRKDQTEPASCSVSAFVMAVPHVLSFRFFFATQMENKKLSDKEEKQPLVVVSA